MWQVGPKTTVRMNLDYETRDLSGNPGFFAVAQRRDTNRNAGMSIVWQPTTYLLVDASLQNARRVSNQPGFDYTSNTINLTAQFTY